MISKDPSRRAFPAPFHPKLKHVERGTVSMATVPLASDPDNKLAASQFIISTGNNTDYLDGRGAIFGKVAEGLDTLEKINNAIVDSDGHPLVDIRIKHTIILDDPYPDPEGLHEPDNSPVPSKAQLATVRIADDTNLDDLKEKDPEEAERRRREQEARKQALSLEMMGDLPFAEVKPPENVLFVCKLNPITTDEDLELLFSRFGKILSCEVIRDHKTGDSLQYAFIEFEEKEQCEAAYTKMQDVLIDDRRIHVDFSQSVSKLSDIWRSEANMKRAAQRRGGWGGVEELEKWRKYREEDDESAKQHYGMIHSMDDMRGAGRSQQSETTASGNRRRSRSPPPRRNDDRRYERDRDRDTFIRQDRGSDRFHDNGNAKRFHSRHREHDHRHRDRRRNHGYREGLDRNGSRNGDRNEDRDRRSDYRRWR